MTDLPAEVTRWATRPLNSEHLTGFLDSGRPEIDEWLHSQAFRLQEEGVCRTYVWGDQLPYVAGFYSLVPHRVESDEDLKVSGHAGGALSGYLIAKFGIHQAALRQKSLLPGSGTTSLENKYLLLIDAVVQASRASWQAGGRFVFIDLQNEPEQLVEAAGRLGFKSISPSGSSMYAMKTRRPRELSGD